MVICELRLQMRNLLIQLLSSALSFTAGNVSICRHGLCLPEQQTTFWRGSFFAGGHLLEGVNILEGAIFGGRQYFGGGHILEGVNILEAFNSMEGLNIPEVMRSKS